MRDELGVLVLIHAGATQPLRLSRAHIMHRSILANSPDCISFACSHIGRLRKREIAWMVGVDRRIALHSFIRNTSKYGNYSYWTLPPESQIFVGRHDPLPTSRKGRLRERCRGRHVVRIGCPATKPGIAVLDGELEFGRSDGNRGVGVLPRPGPEHARETKARVKRLSIPKSSEQEENLLSDPVTFGIPAAFDRARGMERRCQRERN